MVVSQSSRVHQQPTNSRVHNRAVVSDETTATSLQKTIIIKKVKSLITIIAHLIINVSIVQG